MRSAWIRMRPRNFSRAASSFLAAPCSVSMKPEKRGKRGAQFMAGIGDEIGAHALDLLFARQVLEDDECRGPFHPGPGNRRDEGIENAGHGTAQFIVDMHGFGPARPLPATASSTAGARIDADMWRPRGSKSKMPRAWALAAITSPRAIEQQDRIGKRRNQIFGQIRAQLCRRRAPGLERRGLRFSPRPDHGANGRHQFVEADLSALL